MAYSHVLPSEKSSRDQAAQERPAQDAPGASKVVWRCACSPHLIGRTDSCFSYSTWTWIQSFQDVMQPNTNKVEPHCAAGQLSFLEKVDPEQKLVLGWRGRLTCPFVGANITFYASFEQLVWRQNYRIFCKLLPGNHKTLHRIQKSRGRASRLWPFGPALGFLDFIFHGLRALFSSRMTHADDHEASIR